jgi:hypothetical protein
VRSRTWSASLLKARGNIEEGCHAPSINEQCASGFGCHVLGVGDSSPRQLRKGGARDVGARHHHPESILLAVGSVEDVVRQCERDEDPDEEVWVHLNWGVALQIHGLGAVPANLLQSYTAGRATGVH